MVKRFAAMAFALGLGATAAQAAPIDLAARGLEIAGPALLSEAASVSLFVDFDGDPSTVDPFFSALSAGAALESFDLLDFELFYGDPLTAGLSVETGEDGDIFEVLADIGGGDRVLARLTLDNGAVFGGFAQDLDETAVIDVFALRSTTVIPLPAAAPMLLAGIGALAVAARRRRA